MTSSGIVLGVMPQPRCNHHVCGLHSMSSKDICHSSCMTLSKALNSVCVWGWGRAPFKRDSEHRKIYVELDVSSKSQRKSDFCDKMEW